MTSSEDRELVVIGGGPAGLAAAVEARRAGVQTTVIDERAALGGQIYKRLPGAFRVLSPERLGEDYAAGQRLIAEAESSGADIRLGAVAWGIWGTDVAVHQDARPGTLLRARRIVLATGAYDRPVVFPGWTLPGVMTAGGAQSLVKTQRVSPGERVLLAGSGPLLLAFAVELHHYGVRLVAVLEAGPRPGAAALVPLLRAAPGNLRLLLKGVGYLAYLARHGVPLHYGSIILRAEGKDEVERAVVARVDRSWRPIRGTERTIEADTVCVGYGFCPSTELSRLCGCAHTYDEARGGDVPVRDDAMRSTVAGILVAGDCSGIGGSAIALEQGRLAGLAAAVDLGRLTPAGAHGRAAPVRRRLRALERFCAALTRLYPVGPGVHELWTRDTIVCRCEEVTAGEILDAVAQGHTDPNAVKALTRAGMGHCQGRNCARQVAGLVAGVTGRNPHDLPIFTPRPPVKPVPIGLVAAEQPEEAPVSEVG